MAKMTIKKVLERAKNLSNEDKKFVEKAYELAKKAHKGQKRKTGESYIIHPLMTAYYIADLGLDRDTLCAALLHDVIEDCDISEKKITKEFGKSVTKLVKGVTKLRHTGQTKITESTVENLRRFLLVASEDIRVLIIKLADRLHNAKTIRGLKPDRRKEYAREISYIYSALSDYLGIYFFKRQFDDIAFQILQPDEFKKIDNYLEKHHKSRSKYIKKIVEKLKKVLSENKIKAEVSGREKSIYAIHRKIQKYLKEGKIHSRSELGRVYDIFGFRVLVDNNENCYRVLGIIHSLWPPLAQEFEDYIANPKPNGYKSLHTTVFCDNQKLAEVQIRTHKMHEYNEFGPASHIAYKLSGKRNVLPNLGFGWLEKINIFKRNEDKDKKNNYKIKIFRDNIFVLTPANEVKQLPKNGTPIDFAYAVHTEVGNKCRGAKVNGKMVSLDYKLRTGDQVEIVIDKNAQYPNPSWLEFVVGQSTRSKIKSALRRKEEKSAVEKGYAKLNNALKEHSITFNELYKERKNEVDIFMYKNNANDKDAFLARIGFNLLSVEKVIAALFPQEQKKRKVTKGNGAIAIEGSVNTQYTKAKCCDPKQGDAIIGLTTITRGIRIHKKNCKYITNFDKDRILSAEWV